MTFHGVDTVSPVLDEYGAMVREVMGAYLPKEEPRQYLYDPVADYPTRGGKMMRPSLCIATARAFGAEPARAARAAAAIEMLHNSLLIHDDIEDESEERRGRPTLHAMHGIPIALNAGDTLAMLSIRPLLENVYDTIPWLALPIIHDMERMARESAEGQALELGWRKDPGARPTRDDYLLMVLKKTCWLAAIYPCRLGAMLGTRGKIASDAFIRFGFFFGAAFQIQDDVLNLRGGPAYGKEGCGDLWEAKWTLMLIDVAKALEDSEKPRFEAYLRKSRDDRTEDEIAWLFDKMEAIRAIENAQAFARGLAGAALREFSILLADVPDGRDKRFIRDLITWTFRRDH
ncbi:polyprenyl synthetase family protein [Marimonas sp. MJW-29]|uniref:Polyprenyl synthetase family protein n=1 Tax=Sulfitobacter sediminis TaxID=3234186 RepID=A0ABV3RM25_9RHOB